MRRKLTEDRKIEWFNKIKENKNILKLAPEKLKKDKEFIKKCIFSISPDILIYASNKIKLDKLFLLECIENLPEVLEYVPNELKKDETFIFKCYKKIHTSLKYASKELKSNEKFILKCLKLHSIAFNYVSNELLNKDFILYIIEQKICKKKCILYMLPSIFRDDYDIALAAARNEYSDLFHISKKKLSNKNIILEAIKTNPYNFRYASDKLKDDIDIALLAVSNNCYYNIENVSIRLKDNKDFILYTINNTNYLDNKKISILKVISKNLCKDFEVVLNAVSKCCDELQYASYELKDNEIIVKAAINSASEKYRRYYSQFIEYVSKRLRNNFEIMLDAVALFFNNFRYVSDELKNNEAFINAIVDNNIYIDFNISYISKLSSDTHFF